MPSNKTKKTHNVSNKNIDNVPTFIRGIYGNEPVGVATVLAYGGKIARDSSNESVESDNNIIPEVENSPDITNSPSTNESYTPILERKLQELKDNNINGENNSYIKIVNDGLKLRKKRKETQETSLSNSSNNSNNEANLTNHLQQKNLPASTPKKESKIGFLQKALTVINYKKSNSHNKSKKNDNSFVSPLASPRLTHKSTIKQLNPTELKELDKRQYVLDALDTEEFNSTPSVSRNMPT